MAACKLASELRGHRQFLGVSKGGLLLNLVVPSSDSALWLGGVLFPCGPFPKCHSIRPATPLLLVAFRGNDGIMSFGVFSGPFPLQLGPRWC